MKQPTLDPFAILDLPYSADCVAIQNAFEKKMKTGFDPDLLIQAYGMIREPGNRNQFCWDDLRYCLIETEPSTPPPSYDLTALVQELAFLSPWELGEDLCQNT